MSGSAPPDAFGRVAEAYERGRVDWPAEAVDLPARALGVDPGADVLDLAAGTGKLTRLLLPRFRHVLAVEPDGDMRAVLERVVPGAEAVAGTAEAIPLADRTIDCVFVADAFHWFDWPRALGEIARVLRPGGALVLVWHWAEGQYEPPVPEEALDAYRRRQRAGGRPGGAIYESGAWRAPFRESPFEALSEARLAHELVQDREGLIAEALSISSIASLPRSERSALAEELALLVPEATYRQALRVDLYWTRLAA